MMTSLDMECRCACVVPKDERRRWCSQMVRLLDDDRQLHFLVYGYIRRISYEEVVAITLAYGNDLKEFFTDEIVPQDSSHHHGFLEYFFNLLPGVCKHKNDTFKSMG